MMAGLLNDYCKVAGYPFRYQNFSIDQIDSYQGKSGQNAKAFIDAVLDPSVIAFGTIDDIDQVAGKRGDRQSSAGQQEVTAVFMQAFAGAGTVVRGNCTFGMFSNYPRMWTTLCGKGPARAFWWTGRSRKRITSISSRCCWARTTPSPSATMSCSRRRRSSGRWRRLSRAFEAA